jgi:hypothetical protein
LTAAHCVSGYAQSGFQIRAGSLVGHILFAR